MNSPQLTPSAKAIRSLLSALFAICCTSVTAWSVPYIFNSTESAAPGESFYLQGDNFSTNPTVCIHRVTGTESSFTADFQFSGTDQLASVSNQAITGNLPLEMPLGLYAVWVKDSSGVASAPAYINRARAMSFEYGEVPAGYTFRIFGRNLAFPGATPTVTFVSGTYSSPATVVTTYPNDGNVLQIKAPANLPTSGSYTVQVSNGFGHGTANYDVTASEQTILGRAGGTDVFNLGVPWGANFANIFADQIDVVTGSNPHTHLAYGADPSGVSNSVNAIQQALLDAGNPIYHAHGATVLLPSGTFLVNYSGEASTFYGTSGSNTVINRSANEMLLFPPNVVLMGSGTGTTTINDATDAMPGLNRAITAYGANANLSGMLNFTYQQSGTAFTITGTNLNKGSPIITVGGSNTFLSNLVLNFAHTPAAYVSGTYTVGALGGGFVSGGSYTNVLVQNVVSDYGLIVFEGHPNLSWYYNIRNNTFNHHGAYYRTRILANSVQNMVFENNHCTRDKNWPGQGLGALASWEQGGLEADGGFCITVLNNTFDAINGLPDYPDPGDTWAPNYQNCGETIASQWGISQYDVGSPSTVTGGITLQDLTKSWTVNAFAGDILLIVNGPGMGQYRTVAGNTTNTVTVTQPWTENPTTASTYALTTCSDRWLVKGNTLINQPRGIEFYTGSHDCAVVGNFLQDTGVSIYLRSDQRNVYHGPWMSPNWHDIVSDNVAIDTLGKWAATISTVLYQNADSPLGGTLVLGAEFRHNVAEGMLMSGTILHVLTGTNLHEQLGGSNEGFASNSKDAETTFTETHIPGLLATIFDDNTAINMNNAYQFSSETYQLTIWNALQLGPGTMVMSSTLHGATHGAMYSTEGNDPHFLAVSFSGTGGSTGGTSDIVDTGASGLIQRGTGTQSISISSTNAFTATSGPCLRITNGASGTGPSILLTPTTTRTSWGRIFDRRNGQWLVNGGFDYFWRPAQAVTASSMRPIDINNNDSAHGLRLTFHTFSGNKTIVHEVLTGTGGGSYNLTGTYAPGFVAGSIYHLGVTYATDPNTGITTEKIFAASGTGAIITSGSGAITPIATGTFTLNPSVITDTGGFLSGGAWPFGDWYGNGSVKTNDYDGLKLYSVDPGVFAALGQ